MKTLACLALLATPAAAGPEVFPLFEHKDWVVLYVEDDVRGAYCTATVSDPDLYFSVDVLAAGWAEVYVIDDAKNWITADGLQFRLWVDGRTPWIVSGASVWEHSMTYVLNGPEGIQFLKEIAYGQQLYVDYNEQGGNGPAWDVAFSLSGSRAALNVMDDCVGKLR